MQHLAIRPGDPLQSASSVTRLSAAANLLLDRLLAEGRITPQANDGVRDHVRRTGEPVEEALIATQAIGEADLLKYIAGIYRTRFVSTEKLAQADIAEATLARLPQKLAERLQVFPILFDARTQTLSVVTADLAGDVAKHVQMATGARDVRVYASRPSAVMAAIRKFYGRDKHAFAALEKRPAPQLQHLLDVYERNMVSEAALKGESTRPAAPHSEPAFRDDDFGRGSSIPSAPTSDFPAQEVITSVHEIPSAMLGTFRHTQQPVPAYDVDPVAVMNVLVSLLESQREELRGHSSQVARWMGQAADKMGLVEAEKRALLLASQMHDLGKGSQYHLTALNVAEYDGHRAHAQKTYLAPLRLFDGVTLPRTTRDTLTHQYERFDGRGFPEGKAGKDIPLGSRLLAIVETYVDITTNARNPYNKTLSVDDACGVLLEFAGKLFDPNLVAVVSGVVQEKAPPTALQGGGTVLIVDPDPEETTVLELRFFEAGHRVLIARTMKDAHRLVDSNTIDAVVSEVALADGDGFDLLQEFRARQQLTDVPILFVTRRADRESVNRGFGLGASDYLVKPTSADVIVAKAQQLMQGKGRAAPRGAIAGSLREMALPDVVQLLAHGRKTGRLRVASSNLNGEIQFDGGEIHAANFGTMRGEDAIYAMLALKSGTFELDPSFRPTTRDIHASAESLLLEGMRRMDELAR